MLKHPLSHVWQQLMGKFCISKQFLPDYILYLDASSGLPKHFSCFRFQPWTSASGGSACSYRDPGKGTNRDSKIPGTTEHCIWLHCLWLGNVKPKVSKWCSQNRKSLVLSTQRAHLSRVCGIQEPQHPTAEGFCSRGIINTGYLHLCCRRTKTNQFAKYLKVRFSSAYFISWFVTRYMLRTTDTNLRFLEKSILNGICSLSWWQSYSSSLLDIDTLQAVVCSFSVDEKGVLSFINNVLQH